MELKITFNNSAEFAEKIVDLFIFASESNQEKLNAMLAERVMPEQLETPQKKVSKKGCASSVKEVKPDPVEEEKEERLIHSIDELRQAFTKKNTATNRPKLKAILTELGVSKITQLPEDKWDEAFSMLEAI